MIDLGYALIVFAVIAAFCMLAGAFNRAADKRTTQPDACYCGHETDWHRHHHDRTYCAAIDCACHTYRRTK